MPPHCSSTAVGKKELSCGRKMTEADRQANADVDRWAKQAAATQQVPEDIRNRIRDEYAKVQAIATWLGQCTVLAISVSKPAHGRLSRDVQVAKRKPALSPSVSSGTTTDTLPSLPQRLELCPRWQALRERVVAKQSADLVQVGQE